MTDLPFYDRADAAHQLAHELLQYKSQPDTLIFGLVRGGVVTARVLADELNLPVYPYVVRKIGHPVHREFGLGAMAGDGAMYLDEMSMNDYGFTEDHLAPIIEHERGELERRQKLFCTAIVPDLTDKTVIITDDGAAMGVSMFAAIGEIKKKQPKKLIVALPVAATDIAEKLKGRADEIIILATPTPFTALSHWYIHFPQVEDEEVLELLNGNVSK